MLQTKIGVMMGKRSDEMDSLHNLSPFVYSMGKTVRNKQKHPHTFSMECCNVFIFVTGGNAIHEVDGRKRILKKGTLEIIPPFFRQTISAVDETDTEIYYLYFDLYEKENAHSAPRKPSVNEVSRGELYFIDHPSYKNAGEDFDRVRQVILAMEESFRNPTEFSSLERKKMMLELLLLFFRAEKAEAEQSDFSFGHVARAIHYVEKNCTDPALCAKSVADFLGLNPQYLSRLFEKQIHTSLSDYIRITRISRAKELFLLGKRVEEVASACGFSSLPSFSRTFKSCTGKSPRDYLRDALK